jgi:hypothetical protein
MVRRADAGKAGADDEHIYVFGGHGLELMHPGAICQSRNPYPPSRLRLE